MNRYHKLSILLGSLSVLLIIAIPLNLMSIYGLVGNDKSLEENNQTLNRAETFNLALTVTSAISLSASLGLLVYAGKQKRK